MHIDYKKNETKSHLLLSLQITGKYYMNITQVTYYCKGQKTLKASDTNSYLLFIASKYILNNNWQTATF